MALNPEPDPDPERLNLERASGQVRAVTHIAPADSAGNIIGSPVMQEGCIAYPLKELGLCASVTGAAYCTTTEVYPDSPNADSETCTRAQVAAVMGALDYILRQQ